MSLVEDFWPERSVSVTTVSLSASSTKPCSIEPHETWTTSLVGASVRSATRRDGMPSLPSTSASREAGPWPSVTMTTRQSAVSRSLASAMARAVSPRYASTARMPRVRVLVSNSSSVVPPEESLVANGLTDHQGRPMPAACSRTSASDQSEAAETSIDSTSIGRSPPVAAATQDACRNSWLVATRSVARVRTRSGSQTTAMLPAGRTSSSSSMSSTRTGASDSMPSTAMPWAILSRISPSSGCRPASSAALARTASVSSSSRQGGAHRP